MKTQATKVGRDSRPAALLVRARARRHFQPSEAAWGASAIMRGGGQVDVAEVQHPRRVLVVEDEPAIRKPMAAYLQDAGYVVDQADHGAAPAHEVVLI